MNIKILNLYKALVVAFLLSNLLVVMYSLLVMSEEVRQLASLPLLLIMSTTVIFCGASILLVLIEEELKEKEEVTDSKELVGSPEVLWFLELWEEEGSVPTHKKPIKNGIKMPLDQFLEFSKCEIYKTAGDEEEIIVLS